MYVYIYIYIHIYIDIVTHIHRWEPPGPMGTLEISWAHGNLMGPWECNVPTGFPWAHGIPIGPWESRVPMKIVWAHGNPTGPWETHEHWAHGIPMGPWEFMCPVNYTKPMAQYCMDMVLKVCVYTITMVCFV